MTINNKTIRHGKEVFTTSIEPEVLETFRVHCWDNEIKINETIEYLLKEFLQKKVNKCEQ